MKTGFVTLEGRLKREGETDRAGDWDLLISIPSEERYVAVERLLLVLMDCLHLPDLDLPPRLSNSTGETHLLLVEQ